MPRGWATTATLPAAVATAEAFSGRNSLALIAYAYVGPFDPARGSMLYAMIGGSELSKAGTYFFDSYMIFAGRRLDLQHLGEIAVCPLPGAFREKLVVHIHAITGRQSFPLAIYIKKGFDENSIHTIFMAC